MAQKIALLVTACVLLSAVAVVLARPGERATLRRGSPPPQCPPGTRPFGPVLEDSVQVCLNQRTDRLQIVDIRGATTPEPWTRPNYDDMTTLYPVTQPGQELLPTLPGAGVGPARYPSTPSN